MKNHNFERSRFLDRAADVKEGRADIDGALVYRFEALKLCMSAMIESRALIMVPMPAPDSS